MKLRSFVRRMRCLFYRKRYRLRFVSKTFLMGGYSGISRDLRAGDYSYVGPGCNICAGVELGDYSMIGPGVLIVGRDHIYDKPGSPIIFSGRPAFKKTTIGKDVWIGAGSIIVSGSVIGDGAIVAAGAVVSGILEPYKIYAGIPAKLMRNRFLDLDAEEVHKKMLLHGFAENNYGGDVMNPEEAL